MSRCCTQPMAMASSRISTIQTPTTPAFAAPHFRGVAHPGPIIRRSTYSVVSTSSASGSEAAPPVPPESDSPAPAPEGFFGWVQAQRRKSAALREKLVSLGPAAILAYGALCSRVSLSLPKLSPWLLSHPLTRFAILSAL